MWEWLPEGALHHDPNAYLHSQVTVEGAPPCKSGRWRRTSRFHPSTPNAPWGGNASEKKMCLY